MNPKRVGFLVYTGVQALDVAGPMDAFSAAAIQDGQGRARFVGGAVSEQRIIWNAVIPKGRIRSQSIGLLRIPIQMYIPKYSRSSTWFRARTELP